MKIAIYLSGVPAKSKNQQKRKALTDFAAGVVAAGDEVILVDDYNIVDCDIAVIQGWVNSKVSPHLKVRGDAIKHQRKSKKHVVVIDSNLLGFLEPGNFNRYLRYSLDGVFPTTGYYFDKDIDPARWAGIKQQYNFVEKPWQTNGNNILICLQRNGGWSMGQTGVLDWLDRTIVELRQYSDRKIIIRPHPGNQEIVPHIKIKWPNAQLSTETDIRNDLTAAWGTITFNSSPGVASLLWGVPVWVTDPEPQKSQVYHWADSQLSNIENPWRPDRQDFYNRLGQCHFNSNELVNGTAWNFMRSRLP